MSKKKKVIKPSIKRILLFGTISIFCIVVIIISMSDILTDIMDKYKEEEYLKNELTILQDKENELNDEIKKLQDPDYLARYAREKFFYSKEGELIIRIPDSKWCLEIDIFLWN